MPAIALVAAVGTVSAGAALGGVLGGVMLAGGVMSGLGAVTGNKELSKWGAVASLGAGIGSAMGLAGSANSAWNSAVGGADSAMGVTGNSFLADGGSMSAIGDAIGYKGLAPQTPASGALGSGDVGKTAGLSSQTGPSGTAGFSADGYGPPTEAGANINAGFAADGYGPVNMGATPAQPGLIDKAASFGKDAMSFLRDKNNSKIIDIGSGLIGGVMTSYERQRQEEALASAENERRARFNRSILEQRRNGY